MNVYKIMDGCEVSLFKRNSLEPSIEVMKRRNL